MQDERWNPIPNFPGYDVSNKGRLRSYWRRGIGRKYYLQDTPQKLMRPTLDKTNGYFAVSLYRDGKPYDFHIHRLVLLAFVGPYPPNQECRHLDGNAANSSLSNLCWGTRKENKADSIRHGTSARNGKKGMDHPRCKLTETNVQDIRRFYNNGLSQRKIAKLFHMGRTTIQSIVNGLNWRHI